MSSSAGGWFVIVLALICANLPFVNQRLFAAVGLKWPRKPLWLRVVELVVWYVVAGMVGCEGIQHKLCTRQAIAMLRDAWLRRVG